MSCPSGGPRGKTWVALVKRNKEGCADLAQFSYFCVFGWNGTRFMVFPGSWLPEKGLLLHQVWGKGGLPGSFYTLTN